VLSRLYLLPAQGVKFGQYGVGCGQSGHALSKRLEFRAGDGIESDVGREHVEIGSCAAASEAEGSAAGIERLRDDGAGRPRAGGRPFSNC